jgi:hypothetical protein
VSFRDFYTRRAFRILPVYFLVLALTAGALLAAGQFMRNPLGRQFPLYLLFCNEFGTGGRTDSRGRSVSSRSSTCCGRCSRSRRSCSATG